MGWFLDARRRRGVRRAVVGACLAALALSACSPSRDAAPAQKELTVDAGDARRALDGVEVSENNELRLYAPASDVPSAAPTQALPPDVIDGSSGAIRNRTLSELGHRASVDPEICGSLRDKAVSYLAVPAEGSHEHKAVSKDNLTAVTVALKDSAEEARREIKNTVDLYGRCRDMSLSVASINVGLRVSPLDIPVDSPDHSAARFSGSVMGAPLRTTMVQASEGNAVVTVTYFDSESLVSQQDGRSPSPSADVEGQAEKVANTVLRHVRREAA